MILREIVSEVNYLRYIVYDLFYCVIVNDLFDYVNVFMRMCFIKMYL